MSLRRPFAKRSSKGTGYVGYVGDHADKLSRIEPLRLDDEERPSREDLDADHTIFTRPPVPLPRFLRAGRKRGRRRRR